MWLKVGQRRLRFSSGHFENVTRIGNELAPSYSLIDKDATRLWWSLIRTYRLVTRGAVSVAALALYADRGRWRYKYHRLTDWRRPYPLADLSSSSRLLVDNGPDPISSKRRFPIWWRDWRPARWRITTGKPTDRRPFGTSDWEACSANWWRWCGFLVTSLSNSLMKINAISSDCTEIKIFILFISSRPTIWNLSFKCNTWGSFRSWRSFD